jgi:2-keto-4-pentenoate hydratase/2-oxohepta-3-ene-1,7-dioic acid hydratase in catechol pathway
MKILRYRTQADPAPQWGWLDEDKVGALDGSPFESYRRRDAKTPLATVEILPASSPSKIICVGRNYAAHAAEHDSEVPSLPLLFLKPPSSLLAHGQPILLPPQSSRVEHEAELAIVIGRGGRWIHPDSVDKMILGYTIANDVTARDLQRADGQWTRGKGFDTFCPIGPWIETELDPADSLITCTVNGLPRQMGSTRDMIFPARQLIAFASSVMSLAAGDVILTGTPSGVGPLQPGDEVNVEIEGIGLLTNPVEADTQTRPPGY